MALEDAIDAFRDYYASLPARIRATDLLRKRPLALYAAMGIVSPVDLAEALVRDRLAASREMALGYLYERILEDVCGAEKLNNAQKKEWRGIDHRRQAIAELALINLKSARATSNSDISQQTTANLSAAAKKAIAIEQATDDNPLKKDKRRVRAVRAIARGRKHSTIKVHDGVDIEILVGDALWAAMGAGENFTEQIQEALAGKPVDMVALAAATTLAIERVEKAIRETECVDGNDEIEWPCLFEAYPDA